MRLGALSFGMYVLASLVFLLDLIDLMVRLYLRRQHTLLLEQSERLQHTIGAVEELMNAHREGIQLTAEEQVEIFGKTAIGEEYAARKYPVAPALMNPHGAH